MVVVGAQLCAQADRQKKEDSVIDDSEDRRFVDAVCVYW